jgi:hypothetical protein
MRFLTFLFVTGSFVVVGCSGDSSALMSVWNDGGVGGAGGKPMTGGVGGQIVANGGSGGGFTIPLGGSGGSIIGGTVRVTGGTRDLATTQCISTSGGACPVSSSYLTCLQDNCPTNLTACYYSDGISRAAGGICQAYANCMLACSCDANRSSCENVCWQNDAIAIPDCFSCLINLGTCMSKFNCPTMTACSSSTGVAGSGGATGGYATADGAGGYMGAGGATGGTGILIGLDAGPVPPPSTPDAAPFKYDAYTNRDLGPIMGTVDVAPMSPFEVGVFRVDALRLPVDLGTRIPYDVRFSE